MIKESELLVCKDRSYSWMAARDFEYIVIDLWRCLMDAHTRYSYVQCNDYSIGSYSWTPQNRAFRPKEDVRKDAMTQVRHGNHQIIIKSVHTRAFEPIGITLGACQKPAGGVRWR